MTEATHPSKPEPGTKERLLEAGHGGLDAATPTHASPEPGCATCPSGAEPDATSSVATDRAHQSTSAPVEGVESSTAASASQVEVVYIGMHVGGGPNDKATKVPFERALRGAFDAIGRCAAPFSSEGIQGTFGADFLVPADGGQARVSRARSALPEAVRACIVEAFEKVKFDPPRHGATNLSYSVRIRTRSR